MHGLVALKIVAKTSAEERTAQLLISIDQSIEHDSVHRNASAGLPFGMGRTDITSAIDWTLKANYLYQLYITVLR